MFQVLLGFLTSKAGIIVVVGAIIGGLWLWNRHLVADNHTLSLQAEQAVRTIKVLEETARKNAERTAETNKVRGEINNAPDTEDGDVAPVIDRALDLLRKRNSR